MKITLDITVLWHPKDLGHPREYEDAFAVGDTGTVAIADGVSEAIFSKQWADILTTAVVERIPDPDDTAAFAEWLTTTRGRWRDQMADRQLSWMQRQKLQAVRGAYSTLMWVYFPIEEQTNCLDPSEIRYLCRSMGDCCLFHVRENLLLRSFPLVAIEEFERDPATLCSTNWKADAQVDFSCLRESARIGDRLYLATDAFAKWAIQMTSRNEDIDWNWLLNVGSEQWSAWVQNLRDQSADRRMRVDDTTVVCIDIQEVATQVHDSPDAMELTSRASSIEVLHRRVVGPPEAADVKDTPGTGTIAAVQQAPEQGASEHDDGSAVSSSIDATDSSNHQDCSPSECGPEVHPSESIDEPTPAISASEDLLSQPSPDESASEPAPDDRAKSIVNKLWRFVRDRNA